MFESKKKFKNILVDLKTLAVVIILLTTLVLTGAAGCSLFNSEAGETEENIVTEEETEVPEEEEISGDLITTVTLWDCLEPLERMTFMESRNSFISSFRDINIETRHFRSQEELQDQFEAASLAGAGPEIVLLDLDGVQRLAPSNVTKEIIDEVDYALILDGLEEISAYNNKNYIVPFRSYDFLTFYYNKDFIKQPPVDFEQVLAYAQDISGSGDFEEDTYGFILNESEADWIIPFIGGYNGWVIDYVTNSLTLDSQATQSTLEFLDHAYNQSQILEAGMEYGEISELFKNGRVHMIMDHYSSAEEYIEAGVNIGLSKIPRVWEGSRYPTPMISGLGFMINTNTYGAQLEAVRAFIDFMLTEEIQLAWNKNTPTLPVLEAIDKSDGFSQDNILSAAYEQAKICRGKPYDQIIMVIRDAIRDNVGSLLAGDILPADAALKIQEDAIRLRSGALPLEKSFSPEEDSGESGENIEDNG
ncbi:MAG: extracellular solute-binding protein [Actinomycetia bacterium]|nr:extracellular solute-binding protein [Actinomycetes bacterium]